jgi:hypothetical protein
VKLAGIEVGAQVNRDIATQAEAEAGTDNTKLMTPLRTAQAFEERTLTNYLHVRDEKTNGTDGGTASAGTTYTRTLNTVVENTITGASLATNQVTLPAGTYDIEGIAPGYEVRNSHSYLYNVTDGVAGLLGQSGAYAGPSSGVSAFGSFKGRVTIAASKTFELRHHVTENQTTTGLGRGTAAPGLTEVFAQLFVRKVG